MSTSEHSCCCHSESTACQPTPDINATTGMTFKIEGLDCVEEVSILKSGIGPLVGGSDKLVFDVINGRMTITNEAEYLAEKDIIKAVSTTGMKATLWQPGQTQVDVGQRQRSQTLYAELSGVCILIGILIHIGMAGGFADALNLFQSPKALSNSWQAFTDYFSSLLKSHTQQNMPLPEKAAYALAILFGVRYVMVKAFYALKRLRADMNLLMLVAIVGAMVIDEWFEAAAVSFLFSLSLAIESWSVGRARQAIEALLDLAPTNVTTKDDMGQESVIPAAEVNVGTVFLIQPGEKIALDGEVI